MWEKCTFKFFQRISGFFLEHTVHDVYVEPDTCSHAKHEQGWIGRDGQERVVADGDQSDQDGHENGQGHRGIGPQVYGGEAHDNLQKKEDGLNIRRKSGCGQIQRCWC